MRDHSFPAEDNLPKNKVALYELIQAARAKGLSFRYVNVLRHRLMDVIVEEIQEERRSA